MTRRRIGQILVADGTVSDDAVGRALGYQKRATESFRLGSILVNWELLAEEALLSALAKFHRCPSVGWDELSRATPEALRALPGDRAVKLGALPYALDAGGIRIAFRDPSDLSAVDEAAQISGGRVLPAVTTEVRLALAHRNFYGRPLPPQFKQIVQKLERRATAAVGTETAGEKLAAPDGRASAGVWDWPFWTPEEESALVSMGSIRASEGSPANPDGPAHEFLKARSRYQIVDPVLEILLAEFPRVIVLGVGKSVITGWTGRGPGLSREAIAAIRVPALENNILAEVARSGVPHFGPVEPSRFPLALPGTGEARECAVFPIRVLDGVAGLLYADRSGEPMPYEDFAALARGAASTASLLSQFLLTPV